MKLKKLLKKLNAYFDQTAEQKLQTDEGLSKVLKKLKRKEQQLQSALEQECNAEESELLEQELQIVHSQRKKGIALLSEIRKKNEAE